jgi:hypothetical protein
VIVKVGSQRFDSEKVPIMLELSLEERSLIREMDPNASKYCSFPEGMTTEDLAEFMEVPLGDLVDEEQVTENLGDEDGQTKTETTDGDTSGDLSEVRQENAKS